MKMKFYISWILCLILAGNLFAQTGNSLVLNGSNQFMKIPSHNDFNITAQESFTVTCWVKVGRWEANQRFIAKRCLSGATGDEQSGYELWGGNSASQFFADNAPGILGDHTNSMSVWSTRSGSLNTWAHIAFVVDRSAGKMYLYHDGNQVGTSGTKDIAPWLVNNSYDVTVGAGTSTPTTFANYLQGEIDNLRFWKRALSAQDITADMTNEGEGDLDGLVASYDFENITGLSVPDLSGNDHTGILVNYPVSGPAVVASASFVKDTNFTGRGNKNEVIMKVALDMDGDEDVACTNLVLDMNGTTDIADVTNIKIYSTGTANQFDPRNAETDATLLGTCIPAEGEITCALSGNLTPGTNNLWITYDIADQAVEGNQVNVAPVSITTANETFNFTNSAINGSRTILLAHKLLFAPGDAGSKNYRIPAIITAKDGSLVVVNDKRKYNQGDLPDDIDVVTRRSTDGGKTWSDAVTIAQGTGYRAGFGDPGLVRTNEEGGLLCVFVGGEGIFNNSSPSNPTRTYICKSTDNGQTWTQPRDITDQLYGSGCSATERQGWYASFCASGNGLLTRDGRIMWVAAVRETSSNTLSNFVYYSDDNGETWNVSGRAKLGGDESKVTELNDGTILMSIRRQGGGARYYAKSTDGGLTWGNAGQWDDLIEPNCNGDIIRYTSVNDRYEKNRILHSIPNASSRQNVSVFISYDEGETWPIKRSICPTGSAYSSLTILPDGTIGAYVEENYNTENFSLYFTNFSLNWLSNGSDSYNAPGAIEVVKTPVFSIEEGEYEEAFTVELSTETAGASIYYTVDGSIPNEESTLYEGAISIENTTTIKAIAVKEGMANSEIASRTYSIFTVGEYCTGDGKSRTGTDRVLRSISVTGANLAGSAQTFTTIVEGKNATTSTDKLYRDNTSDVLKATVGDKLVISREISNMYWTHFFAYIDYNHDGRFEGDEIVSWTQYKAPDSESFYNSHGELVPSGDILTKNTLPDFIIPASAKTGETRMRVKADWNSLDPCGDANIASNRGYIVDFTIDIYAGTEGTVNYEQVEGVNLKIKNGDEEVVSGATIPAGTTLTIEATPTSDEYQVRGIKLNGKKMEGSTFVVRNLSETISLDVVKGYIVTYQAGENGTLTVTDKDGNILENNADIAPNSIVKIKATPEEHYHATVLVNDEDKSNESISEEGYTVTADKNINIQATFTMDTYTLNYSYNQENGTMTVKNNGVDVATGSEIDYGKEISFKLTPAERCFVSSIKIDDVEKMDELISEGHSSFTLTMTKDTKVEVTFEAEKYLLTIVNETPENGKLIIKREDDTQLADQSELIFGEELSITWEPSTGYKLAYLWTTEDEYEPYDYMDYLEPEETSIQYPVVGNVSFRPVFEQTTSIDNKELTNILAYMKDGKLIIEGAKTGSKFAVYDVLGQQVYSSSVQNTIEVITLPAVSSLYMVIITNDADSIVKKVMNK